MRTKVTITADHVLAYPMRPVLDIVMSGACQPHEKAPGCVEAWVFATADQASDAAKRFEEVKQAMAGLRLTTCEEPGCLDGKEST